MSCISTPTATQFSTEVVRSVSTSFSELVTTLPDTTSTALITSCLSSADVTVSGSSGIGIGTCISSTVITSTTVIDGGVSTTSVPVEITDEFTTSIPTRTLFAPCSEDPSDPPPTITTPTETTEFSDTSTTVIFTPTTTFTSASESTLEDGQITQVFTTVTSVLPPTSSVVSTSVPIATTQANDNDGPSSTTLGAIIGGTLGGIALLLAAVGAIWYIRRRRANWDDIFEKDYEEYSGGKPLAPSRGRMLDLEDEPFVPPANANTEPKPYVYGLVGSVTAHPQSLDAGLAPVGDASGQSVSSHARSSSTTPLMNHAPVSRPDSFLGSVHGSGLSPTPSFTPSTGGAGGGIGPAAHGVPGAGNIGLGPQVLSGAEGIGSGPHGASGTGGISQGPYGIPGAEITGSAPHGTPGTGSLGQGPFGMPGAENISQGAHPSGGGGSSLGPLGVQIPVGAMFSGSRPESPSSVMRSRGPLFIANQLGPISPPASPRPSSPGAPATAPPPNKRTSTGLSNVSVPSLTNMPATTSATGPPAAAFAYLAEKQRLARTETVSSASVYSQPSQPSRAPTPPPAKALNIQPQRTSSANVVVHTDAGRFAREPSDQPPAYQK